jgi:hypothetical protein
MTMPVLATAITCSPDLLACMGMEVQNVKYIPLHTLNNFIAFSTHETYLAKHYPDVPIVHLDAPYFSMITPKFNEYAEAVPVTVYLPRELQTITANGVQYNPADLTCTKLEVLYESERLKKTEFETDFQYAPLGTFQLCKFHFPEANVDEVTLRYKRWDSSKLVAVATMHSTSKGLSPLILVTASGPLKLHACERPRFVP